MKRTIIWMMMVLLALSLCACRPEGEEIAPGGAAAPTEDPTEQPAENETEQPVENEAEQPTEEEQPAEEAENEAATQIPEENAEQPAAESTTSGYTEDPALRAEADRIREEEGLEAYWDFCSLHDIKMYTDASIDDPFMPNIVVVKLLKSVSRTEGFAPDFSCVSPLKVEEAKYYGSETNENFKRKFYIYLNENNKQAVIDAADLLMQLDYVYSAAPSYYTTD